MLLFLQDSRVKDTHNGCNLALAGQSGGSGGAPASGWRGKRTSGCLERLGELRRHEGAHGESASYACVGARRFLRGRTCGCLMSRNGKYFHHTRWRWSPAMQVGINMVRASIQGIVLRFAKQICCPGLLSFRHSRLRDTKQSNL
jgi:hypothetical protein